MYKVVIVDDELYVVALIERLIQWEKLNMEVVGKAYDGLEALDVIRSLEPDIVIVDVCMPEYDGITLMQEIRKMNTNIKFIVISGHKKFEYARSAIQYNIEDYLLKPIDKDEFYIILDKLKKKLDIETSSEEELQVLDQQLAETKKQLRSYFMDMLTEQKIKWEEWGVARLEATYYLSIRKSAFRVAQFKVDIGEKEVDIAFVEGIMESICQSIQEHCSNDSYEMIFSRKDTWITVLFNYNEKEARRIEEILRKQHHLLQRIVEKFERVKITLVLGREFYAIREASPELANVERAMGIKISEGCGRIFSMKDIKEKDVIICDVLTELRVDMLEDVFKDWDVEKLKKTLIEIFSAADALKNQDSLIYIKLTSALGELFYKYLKRINLLSETKTEQMLHDSVMNCMGSIDVRRTVQDFFVERMKEALDENPVNESPAIRLAKKYIAQNYRENITLAQAAEQVNLSRVYFSILFKKETGMNFLEYLNRYRIDIARELLKEIRYNISEVAELSGFQDSRYFSKVFKKAIGISPSDFRNRQMK